MLENGSGLSRTERASAATLAARAAQRVGEPRDARAHRLAARCSPSTARSRSADGGAAGQAHLKGGTLTGVQSVAGYVLDARGRRWVVVMIVNHANANRAQPALDALVEWVQRGGR